jgi:transposase
VWPPAAKGRPRRQAASLRPRDLQTAQHVERCINRLERWRGITTRYDKTATLYLAGLHIAGIFLRSAR